MSARTLLEVTAARLRHCLCAITALPYCLFVPAGILFEISREARAAGIECSCHESGERCVVSRPNVQ